MQDTAPPHRHDPDTMPINYITSLNITESGPDKECRDKHLINYREMAEQTMLETRRNLTICLSEDRGRLRHLLR